MRFKRWLIGLSIVVAVLLGAKVLLLDSAAEPGGKYAIDLAALHKAALSGGPLPTRIDVERVADFGFPETLVVAGSGFRMHPMVLLVHRVSWPDSSIIIDTAMSPKAASIPGAKLDEAAYSRVEKALPKASKILFTHEHSDHVGGVASAPDFKAIAHNVVMTREQFDGPKLERDAFAPGTLQQLAPLDYTGLYTVAPGVVLQKAPGHSVGTQLIYVELASGARYLFIGDIAWSEDNIRLQRGRPALAEWLMKEDRAAVAAQLKAIAQLPKDIHVVTAHDPVAYERDLAAGLYHAGF
ncbi:MAG: beta-lactamase domain protein [Myxococcaceae bacterium]|nr:beta-lactamase domain protein [Myxococcaceae bacterium]